MQQPAEFVKQIHRLLSVKKNAAISALKSALPQNGYEYTPLVLVFKYLHSQQVK